MIRPYVGTRTFRNLVRAREAVVNVTDNVLVFAKSALSRERFPTPAGHAGAGRHPGRRVSLARGRRSRTWRARAPAGRPGPGRRPARGSWRRAAGRPFAGLCRAKHAVVEASILASRARRLPKDEVLRGWIAWTRWWTRPAARPSARRWRTSAPTSRGGSAPDGPADADDRPGGGAASPGVPRPERRVRSAVRIDRGHARAAAVHGGGRPAPAGAARPRRPSRFGASIPGRRLGPGSGRRTPSPCA